MASKEWFRGTPRCTLDHIYKACASTSNFPALNGLGGECRRSQAHFPAP